MSNFWIADADGLDIVVWAITNDDDPRYWNGEAWLPLPEGAAPAPDTLQEGAQYLIRLPDGAYQPGVRSPGHPDAWSSVGGLFADHDVLVVRRLGRADFTDGPSFIEERISELTDKIIRAQTESEALAVLACLADVTNDMAAVLAPGDKRVLAAGESCFVARDQPLHVCGAVYVEHGGWSRCVHGPAEVRVARTGEVHVDGI